MREVDDGGEQEAMSRSVNLVIGTYNMVGLSCSNVWRLAAAMARSISLR